MGAISPVTSITSTATGTNGALLIQFGTASTVSYSPIEITEGGSVHRAYIVEGQTLTDGNAITVTAANVVVSLETNSGSNYVDIGSVAYHMSWVQPILTITPSTGALSSTFPSIYPAVSSSLAAGPTTTSDGLSPINSANGSQSASANATQPLNTTLPSSSPHCTPAASPTGKIAGAAAGTGIGAAILAFLLTFFIMRSRRKSNPQRSRSAVRTPSSSNFVEKDSSSKVSRIVGIQSVAGGVSGWTEHLPQPADDQSILRSIKTLYQQIELHVENFYSDASVGQISDSVRSEMFKLDSELLTSSLYDLMLQSSARLALIKHSLAHMVLTSIDFNEASETSFLPSDFVGLNRSLRTGGSTSPKPATSQAFSQYRVLAAYLRPDTATDTTYLQQRDTTIYASAKTSCNAFRPWASRGQSEQARFNNLMEIMRGAADVGILIFAQPATYSYQWRTAENGKSSNGRLGRTIVVLPAFVKTTDDSGNRLSKPQNVVREVSTSL